MTHNYNYDLALLRQLLFTENWRYTGALGPKKKLDRMFSELENQGINITESQRSRIYGPVGLDIGAETSEEIALSVLSEIKAILSGIRGFSLKEKSEPIHNRENQQVDFSKSEKEDFLCAISNIISENEAL